MAWAVTSDVMFATETEGVGEVGAVKADLGVGGMLACCPPVIKRHTQGTSALPLKLPSRRPG